MRLGLGIGIDKTNIAVINSGLKARFLGTGTQYTQLGPITRQLTATMTGDGTQATDLLVTKRFAPNYTGDGTLVAAVTAAEFVFDEYSDSLFGISARQLRAAYSGDDLTIRRSSDNATDDIGFASNLIDSATASTFIGANNGLVTDFYDQSANANDASESTAANQPTLISSGTLQTINSIGALKFDGSDDRLLVWNNTTAPAVFQTLGSDLTIVARINGNVFSGSDVSWASANTILESRQNIGSGVNVPFSLGVNASSKLQMGIDSSGTVETFASTATISTSTDYYFAVTITGTTVKLFINGTLDSTHTITSATGSRTVGTTASSLTIGVRTRNGGQADANYFDGKINEILLFSAALSDADTNSIVNDSTL